MGDLVQFPARPPRPAKVQLKVTLPGDTFHMLCELAAQGKMSVQEAASIWLENAIQEKKNVD